MGTDSLGLQLSPRAGLQHQMGGKPPVQPQGLVEKVAVNKNAHCSAGYLLSEVAVAFIRLLTYPSRILEQLTRQQFQSRPKSWGK